MALLPITLYGDKILRKKGSRVTVIDSELIALIKNMFDTMRNANGIGLAANQVGSDKSIFVVDVSIVEGNEDIKPMVLINPDIKFYSEDKVIIEEGCLSIPEVRADVERPRAIKITYQDSDLQKHKVEADGILSRVMQHEYDHLQGILFTDRIDDEIKKELKKELNKIRKREIEIDYPVTEDSDYQLK